MTGPEGVLGHRLLIIVKHTYEGSVFLLTEKKGKSWASGQAEITSVYILRSNQWIQKQLMQDGSPGGTDQTYDFHTRE